MPFRIAPVVQREVAAAALAAAQGDARLARSIARFLTTGKEPRKYDIPTGNVGHWMAEARAHSDRCKVALRDLLERLSALGPREARGDGDFSPSAISRRVRPMVEGLVRPAWREAGLRELGDRVFVLTTEGTRRAIEAEFSTSWIEHAWEVLCLHFQDFGLAPGRLSRPAEGMSPGNFAHVQLSATKETDPFRDVIVHEAAHLLHYLKPDEFGLAPAKGDGRFVHIAFRLREPFAYACEAYSRILSAGDRRGRVAFAARFQKEAVSFPRSVRRVLGTLLRSAAASRRGWSLILEAMSPA